ncbi:Indigoidine synthase A like protein [Rhodobacteraceae bacterium HTCC2150]|nr:Indigoidine synthase A like protein [Rhodobacteraceae bacterium HTCC2150]
MKDLLSIAPEVLDALNEGAPVVALESTIISHGMPYPKNLETALSLEALIRENGAVPATIAVINGVPKIGLSEAEISELAQAQSVMKLSRADLAICIAQGKMGATTVAATMILAELAGIDVFATGGIGGVHKGAEESFDISADLGELGKTAVSVVAAGPKAILDVPKTLEVLETQGVPVITYGADQVPAFWSRESGIPTPLRMDAADEIAAAHLMRARLNISGGQLICNPIPKEAEIPADVLAPLIAQAVAEAEAAQINAKAVTPFLLKRLTELTEGSSLIANIALVRNNAKVGAEIAKQISLQRQK